ncbi:MAG: (2Fe-2S)-binding protein [Sebaldella sp.]|nr:(2Fe-2S)-binding protein [Sebaldella sp.]
MIKKISCNVNGKDYTLEVDAKESLLEMLRNRLDLTGAKQGCGVGECGACAVIIDGTTIDSCIYLAVWADGKTIKTIEGVAKNGALSDVQESFIEAGAVQCGFCTPGLIVSSTSLLEQNPNPTRAEIKRGISGNLCRCTGYQKIVEAVENTVEKRKSK